MLAATFGWLCVETINNKEEKEKMKAATFGWLCVETLWQVLDREVSPSSHLRVAVC